MPDFFVCFDLVFGKRSIEMSHEENEPAETQDQDKAVRKIPDLNVASLSERLKLNRRKDSRGYVVS